MGYYLEPGYLPLIRRCVGVLLLCIVPYVFCWSHGGTGPYLVPTWRWHDLLFTLPTLPLVVDVLLWLFYIVSAFTLIFFRSGKAPVVLSTVLLLFFASQDHRSATSYVGLVFTYLIALLFDTGGISCSRRLIQVSVSLCYVCSVLHKLISFDWISGQSMKTLFETGFQMRPIWISAAHALSVAVPDWAWTAVSSLVLLVELFIAFGLWSQKTRKAAIAIGILFHAGLSAVFIRIEVFALIMWTGYLAFVSKGKEQPVVRPLQPVAVAWIVLMLVMPMRIYCWPDRPLETIGFFDRSPWNYGMFIFVEKTDSVRARYQTAEGSWHDVAIIGRMREASCDNDLIALSNYVLQQNPDALVCKVELQTSINGRRGIRKTLSVARNARPILYVAKSSPGQFPEAGFDHKSRRHLYGLRDLSQRGAGQICHSHCLAGPLIGPSPWQCV